MLVFDAAPPRTLLALLLSDGLGRAQSCLLLWGFWVNDGGIAALQVLSDGCRVTVGLLQFTLQEVVVQLGDAFQSLHWGNRQLMRSGSVVLLVLKHRLVKDGRL